MDYRGREFNMKDFVKVMKKKYSITDIPDKIIEFLESQSERQNKRKGE